VRLRIEAVGLDCDLHEALALTTFREGDRLVLFPRWTVDERLRWRNARNSRRRRNNFSTQPG